MVVMLFMWVMCIAFFFACVLIILYIVCFSINNKMYMGEIAKQVD